MSDEPIDADAFECAVAAYHAKDREIAHLLEDNEGAGASAPEQDRLRIRAAIEAYIRAVRNLRLADEGVFS